MNTIAISKALEGLEQCHGKELVGLAATVHLVTTLLQHQQKAASINLSAQRAIVEGMLASHLAARGIERVDFDATLEDLLAAGQPRMAQAA